MHYSPLTVHCTSLCLDVVSDDKFHFISMSEIQSYKDDIYSLIIARMRLTASEPLQAEHLFICAVRDEILFVLLQCKRHQWAKDPGWILKTLEMKITLSHQLYIQHSFF
jgi:hypothetical protein